MSDEYSLDIGSLLARSPHNAVDLVPASQQYIDQLDPEFVNRLETIPVIPEAPWDEQGEKLLCRWMVEAKDFATGHKRTGYILKRRHQRLSISVILSASLVFLTSSLFPCTLNQTYKYIHIFISFISLAIANINGFFNYGANYQRHFEYEGKYRKFAIDIEEILATRADFRPPKDKTLVEFKERKGQLVTSSPEL